MKSIIFVFSALIIVFILSCSENTNSDSETNDSITFDTIFSGKMLSFSDCKMGKGKAEKLLINNKEECISYKYFPKTGVLYVKHINAGFNCCPNMEKIKYRRYYDSIISIDETGAIGLCACNCLFDVEYEFRGISRTRYEIRTSGPLAKYIRAKINLKLKLSDTVCVERDFYPWGYPWGL